MNRDSLAKVLLDKGVETRPFYIPLPSLPPYKDKTKTEDQIEQDFKNSFSLSRDAMYLPSSTELTFEQVDYICNIISPKIIQIFMFSNFQSGAHL